MQRATAGIVTTLHRTALATFRHLPSRARFAIVRRTTPTFSVGTVLVVQRGDRLLVLRQRHHTGWTLPGGLLERGETPHQALVRELEEELQLGHLPVPERPAAVGFHPHERHIDAVFRVRLPEDTELTLVPDGTEVLATDWKRADDPDFAEVALIALRHLPGLPGLTDGPATA